MTATKSSLPMARIPYGTWGSSYFPAWQTSALAEVNIGQFAGADDGVGLSDHRIHYPLALEILERALGGSLHGAQDRGIPHGAGVCHRASGDVGGRG